MNKKRIFLFGDAFESYRSRLLIDFLLESPRYSFVYNDSHFLSYSNSKNLFYRYFFIMLRILDRFYNLYKIILSDAIYFLPIFKPKKIDFFIIKIFKKKVLGEFYISMYDTFVNDKRTITPGSKLAKKLLESDRFFVDLCQRIIFLNKSECEYYMKIIDRPIDFNKIEIMPLVAKERKIAVLPNYTNKTPYITLCWWGNFIPLHGLDKIIEAAKELVILKFKFQMYLFGTSEKESLKFQKKILDLELTDYVFFDNSKHFSDGTLEDFLVENCDIAFGNFGDSEKAKTVMVNKVVEAASMAIPVISQKTKALTEYFMDNESIAFCESTPKGIANKIIELSSEKSRMYEISRGGHKVFNQYFTKTFYLFRIKTLLDNV